MAVLRVLGKPALGLFRFVLVATSTFDQEVGSASAGVFFDSQRQTVLTSFQVETPPISPKAGLIVRVRIGLQGK